MADLKTCIICGKKQKEIFFYRDHHYFKCSNCDIVSTYPYPTIESIKKHYTSKFKKGNYELLHKYASQYQDVYAYFVKIIKNNLKEKNVTLKKMKVLDIGCFTGGFLELLSTEGADVYGLELQKEAVKIANKKLPGKVFQADVMDHKFPQRKYDVISLLGIVEHVTDPLKLIKRSAELLKKNGTIIIQTPDSSSLMAKCMGKYWPPYSPVEHIHLSSRKSITKALTSQGFKNIRFQRHIKILPIGYVYNMLTNFGPEFHRLLKPLDTFLNNSSLRLPFYVGEIIVTAEKK